MERGACYEEWGECFGIVIERRAPNFSFVMGSGEGRVLFWVWRVGREGVVLDGECCYHFCSC